MSNQKHQYKDIGGQAVMEGVMMQSPSDESIAIAVRRPNGRIMVTCKRNEPLSKKHKWMGLPLIRGCVNMVVMLKMGMETLDKSTQMLGVMEEEPSKFEKWLAEKLGASIDKVVMAVAMVLAVALSLFLFVALPSGMATLVGKGTDSRFVINLSAGLTRIAILVGYMIAISFVPDIKRVFMYHGAEHKTVYCNEAGLELTPENARRFSRLHPRCGTAFLFLVMFISILIGAVADQVLFALFGIEKLTFLGRILRSLLTLPIVTGVSYEVLKGLAPRGRQRDRAHPPLAGHDASVSDHQRAGRFHARSRHRVDEGRESGAGALRREPRRERICLRREEKKPEPAGDEQANEKAPAEAREDEKEAKKEDEKNDEKKDGASA